MSQLTQRNIEILKIIVDEFIQSWEVMWSKWLLQKYDLWVSPATVRNDMAKLENLDLLYQPYNSAGRLPTTKGLRAFVNYLMQSSPDYFLQAQNNQNFHQEINKIWDFVHKISFELAKNTWEIAFFSIPDKHLLDYSGVGKFLEENHKRMWDSIFSIIKILEDRFHFQKFLEELPNNNDINIFIWDENILPFLKDYTIVLKPVVIDWSIWYVWIIWSLKMNYSFNISAVRGII